MFPEPVRHLVGIPFCLEHFEERLGYEPEMGDEGVTFYPGKCSDCSAEQVVFALDY